MENTNTVASTAHKQAAAQHTSCATQHLQAAASHDDNKHDEAITLSKGALKSNEVASKQSVSACATSSK